MFRKHRLHLLIIFIHEKNIVYTYLFLIILIALITSGSLNDVFFLNANDMPMKVMFIWTFWYLICIFLSLYELVTNFQSFGQTVKGHLRELDGKSKGKTEQARKVRAKPVGRNQLGVKMQLSQNISPLFGIFWLQKIKSLLGWNGSFYINYLFTSSNVAGFPCAYLPQ